MTRTHEEAMAAAGRAFADAFVRLDSRDPHEAALAAYEPGGPSVAQIEAEIRAERELDQ
jgi:hypothetical protein